MSLRQFLMAAGLSMILILGSCGGEEEATEENPQEEYTETDSADDGSNELEQDAGADEAEETDENATESEDDEGSDENTADVQEEAEDDGTEQSKTFVLEEAGSYNELIYYYVGDEVKRQTSVSEMDYETIGAVSEAEARELLDEIAETYSSTEGVEHNIEYGEDGFIETLEVDYETADISEVAGLDGADFEGPESAQFVSMERSEEQLLSSGYELIEGETASDSADAQGDDSGSDSAGRSNAGNIDFSLTDETLTGEDTEIASLFELNSGIGEMLDGASESDKDIDEVLKPSDEITSYYSETFMIIHAFAGGSDTPAESDLAGLSAEIDESDGFEIYSEMFDETTGQFIPNSYANTTQFAVHDGTEWIDQSGTATAEEVYYGNYSNLHDAFMTTSDIIEISEDDDHYFLHNIGDESSLYDAFGSIFNVEYTGADMEAMENAIVGIVDKSSGELIHVAYISTAPGLNSDETLHIEIAASFDSYGEYDDSGITVPELPESSTI